jgi:hypothetical protein
MPVPLIIPALSAVLAAVSSGVSGASGRLSALGLEEEGSSGQAPAWEIELGDEEFRCVPECNGYVVIAFEERKIWGSTNWRNSGRRPEFSWDVEGRELRIVLGTPWRGFSLEGFFQGSDIVELLEKIRGMMLSGQVKEEDRLELDHPMFSLEESWDDAKHDFHRVIDVDEWTSGPQFEDIRHWQIVDSEALRYFLMDGMNVFQPNDYEDLVVDSEDNKIRGIVKFIRVALKTQFQVEDLGEASDETEEVRRLMAMPSLGLAFRIYMSDDDDQRALDKLIEELGPEHVEEVPDEDEEYEARTLVFWMPSTQDVGQD